MRALRFASYVALFAASLALYVLTLHPDVQPADSGELQLVALRLGVAHPPGYPLYTLLGAAFSVLPIGAPLARISLLSAVASSATLVLVALAVETALRRSAAQRGLALAAGLAAALVLGSSTTFWAQVTTANIRSLTALFTAFMALAAARAFAGKPALRMFALSFGLGVAHHPSLIFPGAVLGAYVLWQTWRAAETRRAALRTVLSAGLIVLAAQLVWLYLPLRSLAGAPLAPDNLATLNGFLDHALARGFGGDMLYFVRVEPERFWDRMALLPMLLRFQFSQPLLVLMAIAALLALWRQRSLALVLLAAFVLHLFITLTYRAPQTVEYAMPAWVLACVMLGVGGWWTENGRQKTEDRGQRTEDGERRTAHLSLSSVLRPLSSAFRLLSSVLCLLPALFALLSAVTLAPNFVTAAADRSARINAERVLQAAPQGGVVLAQWHQVTPLWVLQQVEGVRPDVRVDYVSPNGAQPYGETFAQRGRALAERGTPVLVTSLFDTEFQAAGVRTAPVTGAPAWRIVTDTLATGATRVATFDGRIDLLPLTGLDGQVLEAGQLVPVDIAWSRHDAPAAGDALTVRILRNDGRLAATADVRLDSPASAQRQFLALPLDLEPGEYRVLAGAYRADEGGFTQFKVASGDAFVPVATVTVVPASQPPATQRPMNTPCLRDCAAPQLIGVDYDLGLPGRVRLWTHWRLGAVRTPLFIVRKGGGPIAPAGALPAAPGRYMSLPFDIPPERALEVSMGIRYAPDQNYETRNISLPDYIDGERYVPFGNQMALTGVTPQRGLTETRIDLTWLGARPIVDDWIVSVRLSGNRLNDAHDGVPALGSVPTLKWLRNVQIVDRHPIRTDDVSGSLQGRVIVYDSATRLVLPVIDERYEQGFVFDVP